MKIDYFTESQSAIKFGKNFFNVQLWITLDNSLDLIGISVSHFVQLFKSFLFNLR